MCSYVSILCGRGGGQEVCLPANSVLLHLPARPLLAVEDLIGMLDARAQLLRDVPLRVVVRGRRHGDVAAGEDFARVGEDGLRPPFELFVFCRGQGADEGACGRSSVMHWGEG